MDHLCKQTSCGVHKVSGQLNIAFLVAGANKTMSVSVTKYYNQKEDNIVLYLWEYNINI